jgi:tripartite-type tricarboxylate transporter receptor subunit TctC
MRILALLPLLAACATAHAQTFPSGTVRIISFTAPGVPSDVLSRGLADPLAKAYGVPFIVENRVGADGILGAEACAKAVPDGHSLCSTGNSVISLNPALRKDLPYDPIRDLAPVVLVGFFDSVLVANAALPANTVPQVIKLAQSKPNSIAWGYFGSNSSGYMYEEYLKKKFSAPFLGVPYKVPPQVLQALVTGEAQLAVYAWPNLMPHLKSGKLKPIAVTSDRRLPFMPNVPTFVEEGIKLPLRPYFSFHYQIAVPRPIVQRMNQEIRKAMADPVFKTKFMDAQGLVAADGTPEEFDQFVRDQIRETTELVNFLGIKPQS